MAGDDSPKRPERTQVVGPPGLLAGKYRIGKLIGEGGMGSVYLAEHTGLDAEVAIKLLNETCIADPDSLARFRREAVVMGAVRHDNVVAVMDTGTDEDGVPFIVMEHLEGETLGAMLRRNRTLAGATACRIASQVLSGLAAAHNKGVIHRDLKPGNIFLARQSDGSVRAKILDFGISKLVDNANLSVTADGVAVGTPTYMAPEQIRGELELDRRVDIYAVGVIVYRMLVGKLPFVGGSSEELSEKILSGQFRPPSELRPDVSPPLEKAVLKAMSVTPAKRFSDADEFRSSLAIAARSQLGSDQIGEVAALMAQSPSADVDEETATVAASPAAIRETAPPTIQVSRRRVAPLLALGGLGAIAGLGYAAHRMFSTSTAARAPLRFGVIQFLPPTELQGRFEPFLNHLESRLGRATTMRIATDADELSAWLEGGEVDLAALSPFPYVRARKKLPGLRLIATTVTRGGRRGYYGSILVATDSKMTSLAQLAGQPFCFVRRGSTSGWLLPRRALREAGLDPDTAFPSVHYGQDHLGTLKLLAKGACKAAAVYTQLWHDADEYQLDPASFRSLTDFLMPHDAYVVTQFTSDEDTEELRQALLSLEPESKLAKEVLVTLDQGGFVSADAADYDSIAAAIAAEPSLR